MFLNDQWVNEEVNEVEKFLETNENGNTTFQEVWIWDTVKAILRRRLIGQHSAFLSLRDTSL